MSSRQTGSRYGLGQGASMPSNPGAGNYPWQRNAMLDRMLQLQQSQQQATSSLSSQEAAQEQERMKLENELKEHFLKSQQFTDMATKYGIPASELEKSAGDISKEITSNLIQQNKNIGTGLQSPEVQTATKNQLIAEAQSPDAKNRAMMKTEAPMGGTAYLPPSLGTGMGTTVSGATPGGTSIQQIPIGRDKQGNVIMSPIPAQITSPYTRGGVSGPITPTPQSLQQAQGITPGGTNATPGLQTGVDGFMNNTNFGPKAPPAVTQGGQQLQTGMGGPTQGSMIPNILQQLISNAGRTVGGNMMDTAKQNLSTVGNTASNIWNSPILQMLLGINSKDNLPDATQ